MQAQRLSKLVLILRKLLALQIQALPLQARVHIKLTVLKAKILVELAGLLS